jgi:hypothetical protein
VKQRRTRLPGHAGRPAAVETLHHRRLRLDQAQALPGLEHAVLAVALAGHPDPPVEHGQVAFTAAHTPRLTRRQALSEPVQGRQGAEVELRIHHQSPGSHASMIVGIPSTIQ